MRYCARYDTAGDHGFTPSYLENGTPGRWTVCRCGGGRRIGWHGAEADELRDALEAVLAALPPTEDDTAADDLLRERLEAAAAAVSPSSDPAGAEGGGRSLALLCGPVLAAA